jgi:Flavodoxin-like fold
MKILSINTHLIYPGWYEGKLNLAFMDLAKAFFVERGHQVAETFIERGYDPEEEVKKHAAADLVILQTPVNWFSAPWIYKKYVDEVFNVGLAKEVLLAAMAAHARTPAASMARAAKCREISSLSPRPGMLREETSITPTAHYTPARERSTSPSTSCPTASSQASTFSRIMGCAISSRTPDIPRALED